MNTPTIQKIAVLRANALGDFIFALPALQALRHTFPNAEIVLLGKKWHKDFLSRRPSPLSRVIVVPPAPGIGEPNNFIPDQQTIHNFFHTLQQEKFDVAIQIHGGGKYSNPFVKQLGATYTIGLQTPDAIALDKTVPYVYYQNEYLRYIEVVSLLNAKTPNILPTIATTSSDKKELRKIFSSHHKKFVVIHPGASDIRRRWDPKKFAAVGDFLAKKNIKVIITGTEPEKAIVKDVVETMKLPAINLCGQLTLSGLTALLSRALLVISNDTGPFHLAYALGTPVIGLFWCGNMINGAPLTRKKARPIISWITHCPLCHQNCLSVFPFQPQLNCTHEVSFVSTIPVADVVKTVEDMLA